MSANNTFSEETPTFNDFLGAAPQKGPTRLDIRISGPKWVAGEARAESRTQIDLRSPMAITASLIGGALELNSRCR
jgi:hypothetical protein